MDLGIPEKKLLVAIIERAYLDAQGNTTGDHDKDRPEIRRQADKWLFRWRSDEPLIPFSFQWVCSHLEVCPQKTRRNLKKLLGAGFQHYSRIKGERMGEIISQNGVSPFEAGQPASWIFKEVGIQRRAVPGGR